MDNAMKSIVLTRTATHQTAGLLASIIEIPKLNNMNNDEIINQAIHELKNCEKPFIMFKDFSFMNGLEWGDPKFQKIRYLIIKSSPFEKHTDHAVKLSSLGIVISNDYKDWFDYKKSLRPKFDYAKWIVISIALLSLAWNVFQGISKNDLKDQNKILQNKIQTLEKDNANQLNQIGNKR